jgi:hypothetical protein
MNSESIYNEADQAAEKAFNECEPTPVMFGQAAGLFGNEMVAGTECIVDEGVCGYAWVNLHPARGDFVKFCKQNKIGNSGTYKGWTISMSKYGNRFNGQSMARKEAAAEAFIAVLNEHGINSQMTSRMD